MNSCGCVLYLVNGISIDRRANLCDTRLGTIAVGDQCTRASERSVNGVNTGCAVNRLARCVGSDLLYVAGDASV